MASGERAQLDRPSRHSASVLRLTTSRRARSDPRSCSGMAPQQQTHACAAAAEWPRRSGTPVVLLPGDAADRTETDPGCLLRSGDGVMPPAGRCRSAGASNQASRSPWRSQHPDTWLGHQPERRSSHQCRHHPWIQGRRRCRSARASDPRPVRSLIRRRIRDQAAIVPVVASGPGAAPPAAAVRPHSIRASEIRTFEIRPFQLRPCRIRQVEIGPSVHGHD